MTRIIQARMRTSASQVTSCVASLLALELLHPSRQLYLSAPMLRNTPILPNGFGQFGVLFPEIETISLSLSAALSLLAERGTQVHIIYPSQDVAINDFLSILPSSITCRGAMPLYNKGLFCNDFCLRGAMRFTDFGVDVAEEQVELVTESKEIGQALVDTRQYWEDLG